MVVAGEIQHLFESLPQAFDEHVRVGHGCAVGRDPIEQVPW